MSPLSNRTVRLPAGTPINHTLDKLDQNYVLSGNNIGVGYIFVGRINIDRLERSLSQLIEEFPPLAGRIDFENMRVMDNGDGVPIAHVRGFPGSAADYAVMGKIIRNRTDFVTEYSRKDIERGKAPLMSVKLTDFTGGGSVLGVTINHGLMDAAGFNRVMHRWSDIFTGRKSAPLLLGHFQNFQTARSMTEVMASIKHSAISKPLNFNGFVGRTVKNMMFGALEKIRGHDREMVYLSSADIDGLKTAVLEESGLDWVSTNIAVGAHVLHAIAPLQLPAKAKSVNIGLVVNIRSRVNPEANQDKFIGNALYIMVTNMPFARPVADLSRADFALALRAAFDDLTPDRITRDMQNIVDSLNAGYGYPGLSIFSPIMALNNQAKMNIYGVNFGAGHLLRVIPHDVGDHIMIYPAADGGLEVYIRDFKSLKRQKKLLEPKWQTRLASKTN